MTATRLLALVLVVVLLATVAQPARAEAFDPQTIGLLAGAAVAAVLLTAVVVIGSVRDSQTSETAVGPWPQNGGDDVVILGPLSAGDTTASASAEPSHSDAGPGFALATPASQTP
jgi:hypothetical protein